MLLDENKRTLALPKKYIDIYGTDNKNIIYYDNIEQCIEAVNNGDVDYTYSDIYSLQFHTNSRYYENISTVYQDGMSNNMCIGISQNYDIKFLTSITNSNTCIINNNFLSIYNNEK